MNESNSSGDFATPNPPSAEGTSETHRTFRKPDSSEYSLTIGEASALMHVERCKFASNRKVQHMCRNGVIDCYKLQTTRNGQPVSEWLVNDTSLRKHIEDNEIKWDENVAVLPPVNGNVSLTPDDDGDATTHSQDSISARITPDAVAMPDDAGNASGVAKGWEKREDRGDAVATPEENGNAIGETRSLASILIENAKLAAELEGERQLVAEVRHDREFLREELKDARAGRKDVSAIAERMLETLETIAVGGKLMPPSASNADMNDGPVLKDRSQNASSRNSQPPPIGDNQFDEIERFGV